MTDPDRDPFPLLECITDSSRTSRHVRKVPKSDITAAHYMVDSRKKSEHDSCKWTSGEGRP
jgi:hypothetical protein